MNRLRYLFSSILVAFQAALSDIGTAHIGTFDQVCVVNVESTLRGVPTSKTKIKDNKDQATYQGKDPWPGTDPLLGTGLITEAA